MNEFDQFVKHDLKVKHYARYTDDFVAIADQLSYLEDLLPSMVGFLWKRLALSLHPEKVIIQPAHRGVDFLGYVTFLHHRLIRTRTKRRMLGKLRQRYTQYESGLIDDYSLHQIVQSYLGMLSHADAYKMSCVLQNRFWL